MKRDTEAFRSAQLFEAGIGYAVVVRFKADGRCEAGFFLLDVYCLGAKDGGFEPFSSYSEFEDELLNPLFHDEEPVRMTPSAGRKLIEGAVAYARNLGFAPGADYKMASRVLGGIMTAECEEEFVFGKDGKPFYIQGPSESPERREWILETLDRRCGRDGYEYLVVGDIENFDHLEEADLEGDGAERCAGAAGFDMTALEDMARRMRAERSEVKVRVNPPGRPKLSDRLELVARPLLKEAPDYAAKKGIIQFAALAWNLRLMPPTEAEELLDQVGRIIKDREGVEMFCGLAQRAAALFPDEDRIVVGVETDEGLDGELIVRVMSFSPHDSQDPEPGEAGWREGQTTAFAP